MKFVSPWIRRFVARPGLFLYLLAFVNNPLRAGDLYVDGQDPGCSSSSSPFCTVAAAIAASLPGDTIHIAPGIYVESLLLPHDLALDGTGGAAQTVIEGTGDSTVIVAPSADVEIRGLTLRKGGLTGQTRYGGGLQIQDFARARVADSVVIDCLAHFGGGISVGKSAILELLRSTVADNTAAPWRRNGTEGGYGGGLYLCPDSSTRIVGSTITRNDTDWSMQDYRFYAGDGGGIFADSSLLEATDTVISDNLADWQIYYTHLAIPAGGGVCLEGQAEASFLRCKLSGNASLEGGGICVFEHSRCTLDRCAIEDNECWRRAGGLMNFGTTLVLHTILRGNVATGLYHVDHAADFAGFANIAGKLSMDHCAIVDNHSTYRYSESGGGLASAGQGECVLRHCTIAGNSAGQTTGGLRLEMLGPNYPIISDCIIASNMAPSHPDVSGSMVSGGHNLIGDTSGLTVLGDETGNLYDLDARFLDPNGPDDDSGTWEDNDYSLAPDSPALDSGNPNADEWRIRDLAGHPRLLDGDLDRDMVADMGCYESHQVRLDVLGSTAPGDTLTFETTGRAGLHTVLFVGVPTVDGLASHVLRPYGALFLDLGQSYVLWNRFGTVPDSRALTIPSAIVTPVDFVVQMIAFDPSTPSGNTSNDVLLHIE